MSPRCVYVCVSDILHTIKCTEIDRANGEKAKTISKFKYTLAEGRKTGIAGRCLCAFFVFHFILRCWLYTAAHSHFSPSNTCTHAHAPSKIGERESGNRQKRRCVCVCACEHDGCLLRLGTTKIVLFHTKEHRFFCCNGKMYSPAKKPIGNFIDSCAFNGSDLCRQSNAWETSSSAGLVFSEFPAAQQCNRLFLSLFRVSYFSSFFLRSGPSFGMLQSNMICVYGVLCVGFAGEIHHIHFEWANASNAWLMHDYSVRFSFEKRNQKKSFFVIIIMIFNVAVVARWCFIFHVCIVGAFKCTKCARGQHSSGRMGIWMRDRERERDVKPELNDPIRRQ